MSFEITRTGYVMYKPNWQKEPGQRMRQMNRDAAESYYSNFSALGSNLLGSVTEASAGSVDLTLRIAAQRIQGDYQAKLKQAYSGLNLSI